MVFSVVTLPVCRELLGIRMMDEPVPPEAGSVGPQRKLVTVLGCEDSQPTALDEQQGTEQAEQLARQLGRVQTMVVRHGGLIVWKDQPFPCRVRVQLVAALTPETAVPVFERAGASTGNPAKGTTDQAPVARPCRSSRACRLSPRPAYQASLRVLLSRGSHWTTANEARMDPVLPDPPARHGRARCGRLSVKTSRITGAS